jgi:hypothetical protein
MRARRSAGEGCPLENLLSRAALTDALPEAARGHQLLSILGIDSSREGVVLSPSGKASAANGPPVRHTDD